MIKPLTLLTLGSFLNLGLVTTANVAWAQSTPPNQRSAKVNSENINTYLLGVGDLLSVVVVGYEEFPGTPQAILPDGTINLQLLGRYQASGKTLDQVQRELTQLLGVYLVAPRVEVTLSGLRPVIVTVSGEVRRPGPVQLESIPVSGSGGSSSESDRPRLAPTLSQAISAAGGVNREANIRDVTLTRVTPSGVNQTISINLWDAIQSNQATQDIFLRDGDSIFVPKASSLDNTAQNLLARSSYGPESVRIQVIGEVRGPGSKEVPPDISISQAIAFAGGPTDKADMGKVRFFRLQPNGQVEERRVNLSRLADTTQVDDGDVIFVPKGDGYRFIEGLATIVSPFSTLLIFERLFN